MDLVAHIYDIAALLEVVGQNVAELLLALLRPGLGLPRKNTLVSLTILLSDATTPAPTLVMIEYFIPPLAAEVILPSATAW